MGVVYEVRDRKTNEHLALKTLKHVTPQSLFRLKREFRAAQGLQHPNLVSLGELFESDGQWYFTMELVPGTDFMPHVRDVDQNTAPATTESIQGARPDDRDLSPQHTHSAIGPSITDKKLPQPANERRLRPALQQLALGIAALHRERIIHRDIKPSNVRVTPDGRVVVLDFGVATLANDEPISTRGWLAGTPSYMAPEQAVSADAQPAADWYSFGVVLYEALTGRLPYTGRTTHELLAKKQKFAPPPPRAARPGVPEDLDQLCVELLRIAPDDRPKPQEILERLGVADELAVASGQTNLSIFTQTSAFFAREQELSRLNACFLDVQRGIGRVVAVLGNSGVGKSSLIRHFAEVSSANVEETVVLEGRCYRHGLVPFKAFDGVIEALSHHLCHLEASEDVALVPRNARSLLQIFPSLGRVECLAQAPQEQEQPHDPHEQRTRAFEALRDLLQLAAEHQPLMIVIDDLQWADADSLLLLQELLTAGSFPPLLLVMSSRGPIGATEEAANGEAAHARAIGPAIHNTLQLTEFQQDEAIGFARLLLAQTGLPEASAATIAKEAQGHPLHIDELVRYAATTGDRTGAPLSLDAAIWTRIGRLDGMTRRVLELIAVASAPLQLSIIAHAAKLSSGDLTQQVRLLRINKLARSRGSRATDTIEPYHNRVREAVLANLSGGVRVERHARLAVALESAGAASTRPELLQYHLHAAGDRAKSAKLAVEAAANASKALAFARAARLYRSALELGEHSDEQSTKLHIALGEALTNAGLSAQSADAYLEGAKLAEPATRLDCERRAAEQLLAGGHIERGIGTLRGVLAAHGIRFPRTPRRALVSVLWGRARLRVRGLKWTERHLAEIARSELARIDVYRSVAQSIGMVDSIRGADFQIRGLHLALATGEKTRIARFLLQEAIYVGSQGAKRLSRAHQLLAQAKSIADEHSDDFLHAWVVSGYGILDYFDGKYHLATQQCAQAEEMFRSLNTGAWWEITTISLFRMYALVRMGAYRQLTGAREQYLRDASHRGDRYAQTTIKRFANSVWLAQDKPDEALSELAQAEWPVLENTYHLQHWYDLCARAEVALYRGQVTAIDGGFGEGFARLEGALLVRVEIVRMVARWLRGRLALSAAREGVDTEAALKLASRMARALERETMPSAPIYAGLLRAGIMANRGEPTSAAGKLRELIELSTAQHLPLCAEVARLRLGHLVGGDQGAELIATAHRAMTTDAIVNPDRMCELIAPGFATAQ